ncbi:unnamed protein product [Lathyrus oleraceus]
MNHISLKNRNSNNNNEATTSMTVTIPTTNNNDNGEFVHIGNVMKDSKISVCLRFELPSSLENYVSVSFAGEE